MQCAATLASGKPCRRAAQPSSRLCRFHSRVDLRREAARFYRDRLSDEEQTALAVASQLEGVDAEVAVLRVLIRRVLSVRDIEAARRGIDTLCRMLKAQHALDERGAGQLTGSIERLLDQLDTELGATSDAAPPRPAGGQHE